MKENKYFRQGIYKPIHPEKFLGKVAQYRSSYELKFCQWCDKNPKIIKWGSENVVIPYISPVDGRVHRYFVDNVVYLRDGDNIFRYLVEIKPKKQTIAPVPSKRKKKSTMIYEQVTWAVNQAKWDAAKDFAARNKMKFLLLTEQELFTT